MAGRHISSCRGDRLVHLAFFIIHLQSGYIKTQQSELQKLSQWETTSRMEIDRLRSRLQPLEQLGILRDTVTTP